MKILPRTKFGNPVLRKRAAPVTKQFIASKKCRDLIATMFHTMHRAYGVGLAAPQIDHSIQLAVIQLQGEKTRFVIMNPKIIAHGTKQELGWEGCLSLPGVRGVVPRYETIRVRYIDEHGKTITRDVEGFLARVFQHEIDHLNGFVYVDRMRDMKTLSTEQEYIKRVIKKKE